jgi:hypothetical protein
MQKRQRFLGLARSPRYLVREEDGAETISDEQVRIQLRGDLKQRPQECELCGMRQAFSTKVLHYSRPIDVREQSFVSQAELTQKLA